MTLSVWLNWCLSVIVTGVNWLKATEIIGIPILYFICAIIVMGVVIANVPFRS